MFKNKTILITGGTGSLGRKLVERIIPYKPKEIRIFSRSEALQDKMFWEYPELKYILGDVRDLYAVRQAVKGADIVIHAAAFKYLDLAEVQTRECVLTNIAGSLNVIEACKGRVKTCVGISTDKAVYARNAYGCTKHIMEKLLEEANRNSKTNFVWVRYGNVIGTTGSVIPKWLRLKKEGKSLTITDIRMTRFFMTLDEAADAVFKAIKTKKNYIHKMKSAKMIDIALAISSGIKTGKIRPGEKLHETLIADYEGEEYTSDKSPQFDKKEIKKLLEEVDVAEFTK